MSRPGAAVPALHVVTDDAVLGRADFTAVAEALMRAFGPAVALHVRGPGAGGLRIHDLVAKLVDASRRSEALLVVNDRVDVALAFGDVGAHLGARSLPVAEARALLGRDRPIGASTHGPGEAAAVASSGASWVFAGTVWATPGHPDAVPCGPEGLAAVVDAAGGVPVLAIGGVTPARVAEARAARATGVAVIRGIWDAPDPVVAAGRYLEAIERGPYEIGSR